MRSLALMLVLAGCTDGSIERVSQALVDDAGEDGGDDGGIGGVVVISQIYGAGGVSGSSWHNDYVELFNRGDAPAAIGGWSVQYGSSTSPISLQVNIPDGTMLAAGHYFLVSFGSGGSHGADLPAPDVIGTSAGAFNLSGADGKVALVSSTATLGCGIATNRCSSPSIVDLVGYGQGTDYEGSAAPSPIGGGGAIFRQGGGCIDSNDNASDFVTGTATPRNSSSPPHSCVGAAMFDLLPPPDLRTPNDLSAPPDLASADSGASSTGAPIVISQIYGAGGTSGASFRNDYVELFNRSDGTIEIGGWSLQYASKDNTFSLKVDVPDPTSMPPGSYYLIRLSGGSTGASVAEPDLTVNSPDVLNMSGSDGKVALVAHGTLIACGSASKRCMTSAYQDLVGYGVATDYEGAPTMAGSAAQAMFRRGGGCIDTNHNDADFELAGTMPRNSGSSINQCSSLVLDLGVDDAAAAEDAGAQDLSVRRDAATAPRDLAAVSEDMEIVLTRDLGAPVATQAHGCGCQLGAAPSPANSLFAALALALLAFWRARRSRGRRTAG